MLRTFKKGTTNIICDFISSLFTAFTKISSCYFKAIFWMHISKFGPGSDTCENMDPDGLELYVLQM